LALLIVLLVSLPSAVAAQSIPEAGVPEAGGELRNHGNMISWNMCNGANLDYCHTGGSNGPGVDLWQAMQNDPVRPLAVGTQEMCTNSFQFLRGQLLAANWGYGARFWISNHPDANCEQHGNGMFWGGGDCGTTACIIREAWDAQGQNPDEHDDRGVVCGHGAFPAFTACSSHLSAQDGNAYWRHLQANEYRYLVSYINATEPAFAMGDFNMVPDDAFFNAWYNDWDEGDGCTPSDCGRNTFSRNGTKLKLDYGWVSESTHFIRYSAHIVDTVRVAPLHDWESDHHIYYFYPEAR
jgi:hypothetical protein